MFENTFVNFWNRRLDGKHRTPGRDALDLGRVFRDGQGTNKRASLSLLGRIRHLAVLGKTGVGKSFLLLYMVMQDIARNRGFCFFDLHGEATRQILKMIAERERLQNEDLSCRTILIEPADPDSSVGLNILEGQTGLAAFVQVAEFTRILRDRWRLHNFGARTEELLRNSLLVLKEKKQTLIELRPLLTDPIFRAGLLREVDARELKDYFAERFNRASPAMQAAMAAPILNKASAFTQDPHFRHILGQEHSTFSLRDAIDQGFWIILNLEKGRLGEQALTLGSLFLTKLKNALFARKKRDLFTLFLDEVQNLVAIDDSLDTLFTESRKFGVGAVSANQFLDQYPPAMRASILAVNSHVFFRLSGRDAERMASMLGAGTSLAARLKGLPQRRMVARLGTHRPIEARVPFLEIPAVDSEPLRSRLRKRWTTPRVEVEQAIKERQGQGNQTRKGALDDWD